MGFFGYISKVENKVQKSKFGKTYARVKGNIKKDYDEYQVWNKKRQEKKRERLKTEASAARAELKQLKIDDKNKRDIDALRNYKNRSKPQNNAVRRETSFPDPLGVNSQKKKDIYKDSWI